MKCHYVPQSYLKRFKDSQGDAKIACYDRLRKYDPCKRVHPKNTSQLEDYYNLRGFKTLVEALCLDTKKIENEFPLLFENGLNLALDNLQRGNVSEDEMRLISRFVAFQLRRTPQTRKEFESDIIDYQAEKELPDLNVLAQQIANKVKVHEETKIFACHLENLFLKATWKVISIDSDSCNFITSDNPILLNINPLSSKEEFDTAYNVGLDDNKFDKNFFKHLSYAFSVSPSTVVIIEPHPDEKKPFIFIRCTWEKTKVEFFNDQVFKYSFYRIYTVTDYLAKDYLSRFSRQNIKLVNF